ncbi:hypothetical protein SARC_11794 [Sphaeroforma arctica JP610]|uniref:Uncharacterized protein n=1 Tax=Sphaeroforma arctica JP610 TaxID=667725 RepID=A0A0L0FFY4_9EUKA|nr:hypothetical protein SARC_11794 [Sphaeroforma arctica JP610]KNC75687.1 hypothetical protein SARC_11794 [Sphaeroforma arctica JP610]|eukprot:XP_014149589.1 hypothetical protein SARC_11794 [Sphaeroforma arctica JP610]
MGKFILCAWPSLNIEDNEGKPFNRLDDEEIVAQLEGYSTNLSWKMAECSVGDSGSAHAGSTNSNITEMTCLQQSIFKLKFITETPSVLRRTFRARRQPEREKLNVKGKRIGMEQACRLETYRHIHIDEIGSKSLLQFKNNQVNGLAHNIPNVPAAHKCIRNCWQTAKDRGLQYPSLLDANEDVLVPAGVARFDDMEDLYRSQANDVYTTAKLTMKAVQTDILEKQEVNASLMVLLEQNQYALSMRDDQTFKPRDQCNDTIANVLRNIQHIETATSGTQNFLCIIRELFWKQLNIKSKTKSTKTNDPMSKLYTTIDHPILGIVCDLLPRWLKLWWSEAKESATDAQIQSNSKKMSTNCYGGLTEKTFLSSVHTLRSMGSQIKYMLTELGMDFILPGEICIDRI